MPFRKAHPALNWHAWQFWIVVAFFWLGAWAAWGYVENHNRIEDLHQAGVRACVSANDSRAATRLAWARVEAYIVKHSTSRAARAQTVSFFDNTLGPGGHRDQFGPLKNRPC